MIGVIAKPDQIQVAEEFFELFKTPWEPYRRGVDYDVVIVTTDEYPEVTPRLLMIFSADWITIDTAIGATMRARHQNALVQYGETSFPIFCGLRTFSEESSGSCCLTASGEIAGLRLSSGESTVMRIGYDLFDEVRSLFSTGQPAEHAHIPTLDLHIKRLREWIIDTGISLLEVPPCPAGYSFAVCLTHDIDFVGIRNHRFDHSMWGFLYRATIGSVLNFARRRLTLMHLLENWLAALSLPFVQAGWAKDFWEPFEWYLEVEKDLGATYFLIPFKHRSGENVPGPNGARRATSYDIGDIPEWTQKLLNENCEIGVHGLDAWHCAERGRVERARIESATGSSSGIRMHWLLRDPDTPLKLEQAGYTYDSTFGYNETVGYRAGTSQVFRPLGARRLLELPLHIQDGALFYRQRLDLSELEAKNRCQALIDNSCKLGGVLTFLWHDRSHAPERFWGGFYVGILQVLKALDPWFGTASQIVNWFQKRREVRFERMDASGNVRLHYEGEEIQPPLRIRYYPASNGRKPEGTTRFIDVSWNGRSSDDMELQIAAALPASAGAVSAAI